MEEVKCCSMYLPIYKVFSFFFNLNIIPLIYLSQFC